MTSDVFWPFLTYLSTLSYAITSDFKYVLAFMYLYNLSCFFLSLLFANFLMFFWSTSQISTLHLQVRRRR